MCSLGYNLLLRSATCIIGALGATWHLGALLASLAPSVLDDDDDDEDDDDDTDDDDDDDDDDEDDDDDDE